MGLDKIIQRLQALHPFNIYEITAEGAVKPWYDVTGQAIVPDLVIRDSDIQEQVQVISSQIMHWGRLAAQCNRVWEIEERNYRVWRSGMELAKAKVPEGEKAPTKATVDAMIRTDPMYLQWYQRTERAEEAYNATTAILNGFRAKKDMLREFVYRRKEDGAPILSV